MVADLIPTSTMCTWILYTHVVTCGWMDIFVCKDATLSVSHPTATIDVFRFWHVVFLTSETSGEKTASMFLFG